MFVQMRRASVCASNSTEAECARAQEKEQRLLADAERMILEATKKATNGLILQVSHVSLFPRFEH